MSLLRKISPKKTALGLLIFLIIFTVTGFFILPPIIKSVLTNKLSEQLHRPVAIEKVRVNPFILSVEISGFTIREPHGGKTFISFGTLYENAQSISIFKGGPVLKEIRLERPYILIVRNRDLSYNFNDLVKPEEKEKKEPSKPFLFSLSNIQIQNGGIDFEDTPKGTTHSVRDMNLSAPFVSNLPYYADIFVRPGFAATVNGTPVALEGKTKPFKDSLETSLQVDIKDLDIAYYLATKLPVRLAIALLTAKGRSISTCR